MNLISVSKVYMHIKNMLRIRKLNMSFFDVYKQLNPTLELWTLGIISNDVNFPQNIMKTK